MRGAWDKMNKKNTTMQMEVRDMAEALRPDLSTIESKLARTWTSFKTVVETSFVGNT